MFKLWRNILLAAILSVALGGLLSGCAAPKKEVYIYPFPKKIKGEANQARIKGVLEAIRERNETVENSPDWIEKAYKGIIIKDLRQVPPEQYGDYNKYVRGRRAFIIVHPSFFTFFDGDKRLTPEEPVEESYPMNLVERFYERASFFDESLMVLQLQERDLMGFLEVFTTEKVLLITIIPRDYQKHMNRRFVGPRNEYARYINEVTNESEGALFIESEEWNTGNMKPDEITTVVEFLKGAGVGRVYLGGGYVGRCLGDFYDALSGKLEAEGLEESIQLRMVPEMSGISPFDLKGNWLNGLLTPSGKLNRKVAAYNLRKPGAYFMQALPPKMKRFYVHEVELEPRVGSPAEETSALSVAEGDEQSAGEVPDATEAAQ